MSKKRKCNVATTQGCAVWSPISPSTADYGTFGGLYDCIISYSAEVNKVAHAKLGGAFLTGEGKAVFIKKVVYSDPATIVFWSDNTKTISKCAPRDDYNPETGLAVAVLKKISGNANVRKLFTQWLPQGGETIVNIADARRIAKVNEDEE